MKRVRQFALTLGVLLALSVATNCNSKGQLGSETNWLGMCVSSDDCVKGSCICGICTKACNSRDACGEATCVEEGTMAYAASCGLVGRPGICATGCKDSAGCSRGLSCVAGACIARSPNARDTAGRDAGSDPACTPEMAGTSEDAVSVLASSSSLADLVLVAVTGVDVMTADGRSRWHVVYTDRAGTLFSVEDVCGTWNGSTGGPDPFAAPCAGTAAITPLPSDVLVPDALDRVTSFIMYDSPVLSFDQRAACLSDEGTPYALVQVVGGTPADPLRDWWNAYYTENGVLARLCGPCTVDRTACATCTSGPDAPFKLTAAPGASQPNDVGCLAYDNGNLVQGVTGVDAAGQLTNTNCVIAMVEVGNGVFLMAGPTYDVALATPDSDRDSVRHAVGTVEDVVKNGTFAMKIYPLDALDDATQLVWSGSLFIGSFDARAKTAWFAGAADSVP